MTFVESQCSTALKHHEAKGAVVWPGEHLAENLTSDASPLQARWQIEVLDPASIRFVAHADGANITAGNLDDVGVLWSEGIAHPGAHPHGIEDAVAFKISPEFDSAKVK